MKLTISILYVIFLINVSRCKKIEYYPDENYREVKTKIIAHRGGGESPYQENSFEAAEYGLKKADGIELDVQISKDQTIWLAHGVDLPDCGGISYSCYPETEDEQIMQLDSCSGDSVNFTMLKDVFELLADEYSGKYISLDVKAWIPCGISSVNVLGIMNLIGTEIIRLTEYYKLHDYVMISSETASFLNHVQNNSEGIDCYLMSFGDYEKASSLALDEGYAGISLDYKAAKDITPEFISLIRRKGLKILLWTLEAPELLEDAFNLNPDFIISEKADFHGN